MEDLDKYLKGQMGEEERQRFEQKLAEDPISRTELRLREGLRQVHLKEKVSQVATLRKRWQRQRFWRFFGLSGLLAGLVISLLVFLFQSAKKTVPEETSKDFPGTTLQNPSNPKQKAAEQKQPGNSIPSSAQKNKKRYTGPIADISQDELDSPLYPSPNVRGENEENPAWKALLDKIWYTDYPFANTTLSETFLPVDQLLKARDFGSAYVRLQRLERTVTNDTLSYLKGYCLLEMGEGAAAFSSFAGLEVNQPNWTPTLEWFRGLSLLIAGEKEKAITQFKTVAAQANHPYRLQSERAIKLLQ